MFRIMLFLIASVISSSAISQTFSLDATSSSGSYSIHYSASGAFGVIDEWDGTTFKGIGGGQKSGTITVNKTVSGTFMYRMQNCNVGPGPSGAVCVPVSGTKSITVTLVPPTPVLSVAGLENPSANIDTNGTFSFSWNTVATAEAYAVERDGGVIYYDTAPTHSVTSFPFGTYSFRVKACRANATVCSGYSNTITITIQYPRPTTPSGPTFSGLESPASNTDTNGAYTISWGDSVGAEAYLLQRNGQDWYWGSNRSFPESGVQPGPYTYTVKGCRDSATNCSTNTASQTITVVVPTPSSSSRSSSSVTLTSSSRSSSSVALTSSSRSSSSIALTSSSRSSSSVAITSTSSSSVPAAQTTTTTYVYDDLGRIKTVTHPNVVKNTYTYDSADNRTKKESTAN